ncbi:BLUF domain-containing protein [Frigoribacterium sp. CFBP 13729]|uniref:BLUF domain-containing protein n=1 Tax=unclassified Frigoribacterium TaxID=2627005 RepID=UPI00177DF633|nr:BLUF domain-containing protein [Frigoribacterium sp. CFBP 13729]
MYTSAARTPFDDGDLATLLMNSRANNRRLGLSGFLMHKQGRFVQVLEGPDAAVQARYDVIAADPRHTDLAVLLSEPIEERRFADWSMGYRPATDELAEAIPGYADVTGAALDDQRSRVDLDPAVRALLDWFRAPVPAGA